MCIALLLGNEIQGISMFMGVSGNHDFSIFVSRRKDLLQAVKQSGAQSGLIVLFAGFEDDCRSFKQESSFFYLTGIQEPGVVLVMDMQGKTTLYKPNCGDTRSQWVFSPIELTDANAKKLGLDAIAPLGQACAGYQIHPFFPQEEYQHLIDLLANTCAQSGKIFTLCPDNASQYVTQRLLLHRLESFIPAFRENLVDISPIVAEQRRRKDMAEIEHLYKAVEITTVAQEAAAQAIKHDVLECEVQASLEYIFLASGARPAFPSIVGSGKNSTVLHYNVNRGTMKSGDLVVVDIGAEYDQYCADITRTYPVNGVFSKRQREVYNIVLETQEYIATIAKPGYWLRNAQNPDKSLHHLAKNFLAKKGYDKYFPHGIGHFLGLDVHDVGDYDRPLQEGDVFTIEPGIYIPEEKIGIRIEDDYWVVKDGVVCLSENLPKKPEDIEALMKGQIEDDFDEDEDIDDFNSDDFDDEEGHDA